MDFLNKRLDKASKRLFKITFFFSYQLAFNFFNISYFLSSLELLGK